jgi:hypothetical protein
MKPEPADDSPLAACKVTPRAYLCPFTPRTRKISSVPGLPWTPASDFHRALNLVW